MSSIDQLKRAIKAARTLGLEQTGLYALYQLGLRSGLWQRLTPINPMLQRAKLEETWLQADDPARIEFQRNYQDFMSRYPASKEAAIAEAKEIITGRVRLFGGPAVRLMLAPPAPLHHWSVYERGAPHGGSDPDIKMIWEPARLGWVFPLARAYMLTGDHGYAQCYWRMLASFLENNPANQGPNWVSAQEAAIRVFALAFGLRVFAGTLPEDTKLHHALPLVIAAHAARILPTMLYARAQHNNHLLTEAAGLITAGLTLPNHPHARHWRSTGWRWLERGLRAQIAEDGTYAQHSTNYHRLMLQTALWAGSLASTNNYGYANNIRERLAASTYWLLERCDFASGRAINLGSNDGAYLFPLAGGGFGDFRPVLQAAAREYLGAPAFPPGPWDEYALWLNWLSGALLNVTDAPLLAAKAVSTRIDSENSWGSLRAVQFHSRPSHADQLHVDLWRAGQPVTLDAGTYRYTAPPPWDNTLARTAVHNTITVDDRDQMTRAGRFLWLDWAQARGLSSQPGRWIEAEHYGYRKTGVLHRRKLELLGPDRWQVTDSLLPTHSNAQPHVLRLHWLLADGEWQFDDGIFTLNNAAGRIRVTVSALDISAPISISLVRAGECLHGEDPRDPNLGWHSPTYNLKEPAVSLCAAITERAPVTIITAFSFE